MSVLLSLVLFFLIWLSGALLAVLVKTKSFIEVLGLGFILGTFMFTLSLIFYHSFTGSPINVQAVFIVSGGMTLLLSPFIPRLLILSRQSQSILKKISRMSLAIKIVIGILFTLVFISAIQNFFWPITDWDAMALYDFRAKIVAETGSFSLGRELGYFYQYPPFTSLLHTSVYVLGFQRAKIWYSFLYGSFLLVFYSLSRKQTSPSLSLSATLALAVNPLIAEHAIIAYTNLAYTMFLGLGIVYLWQWFTTRDSQSVILGGVLVAASCWSRSSEPFWLVGVMLLVGIAFLAMKHKIIKSFIFSILGALLIFWLRTVWPHFTAPFLATVIEQIEPVSEDGTASQMFSQIAGLTGYFKIFARIDLATFVERFVEVSKYFYNNVASVFALYFFPGMILLFFDIKSKQYRSLLRWMTTIDYVFLIFLGTFLFSFSFDSWNEIGGSANRMSMFLIPLFIFSIFTSKTLLEWVEKIK